MATAPENIRGRGDPGMGERTLGKKVTSFYSKASPFLSPGGDGLKPGRRTGGGVRRFRERCPAPELAAEEAGGSVCSQKLKEREGECHSMAHFMDLRAFILRARVLKLYRQALRMTRRAPVHARDELRQTVRAEIEKNRRCDDKQKIKFLISEGLQRLKGLDEMLDMTGNNTSGQTVGH
uniref:LYR motif-containing protein 2 n=1 Tax=Oryza rufipogon TaxID=4529 RepID=A0A0E0NPY6_ORYRU